MVDTDKPSRRGDENHSDWRLHGLDMPRCFCMHLQIGTPAGTTPTLSQALTRAPCKAGLCANHPGVDRALSTARGWIGAGEEVPPGFASAQREPGLRISEDFKPGLGPYPLILPGYPFHRQQKGWLLEQSP